MKTAHHSISRSVALRISSLWLWLIAAAVGLPQQPVAFAQAPIIAVQPLSQTVPVGARVALTVTATGNGQLRYQWKKNGVDLGAETSATLSIASATTADAGDYAVVVANDLGAAASAMARLKVLALQSPVISSQPVSQTVSAGATVTFRVAASGNGSLNFQWLKNGVELAGEASATLTLETVTSADAGNYSVLISNATGVTASTIAALTVTVPDRPVILVQPVSQTVPAGAKVTLQVEASGSGQLQYQWKKNGADISGQTSAALTIQLATAADAGDYSVAISNAAGVTTSAAATLVVASAVPPTILVQPASQAVEAGAKVVFAVNANGSAPLSFQWLKNGANLSGQTSATLALNSVTSADAGDYSVVVSNLSGTKTSAMAKLTVAGGAPEPPIILVEPISQTIPGGAPVSFSVAASGSGQLRYQWKKNGVDLAGQTSATLTISATAAADAGDYAVTVSNQDGVAASALARLTIGATGAPKITVHPVDQHIAAGASVTFTAQAEGTAPFSFQWKKNGIDVSGATGASLTLNSVAAADIGDYSVVVANSAGVATSLAATLDVAPQPAPGSQDQAFVNGSISSVNSVAVQADGEVVVAGGFTEVGGIQRNRIARLNTDGSLDASFGAGAGANGEVHEVVIQADGKILIAGEFTSVQGADRNRIARLNADGSLDSSFNVGAGANDAVHSLAIRADGKIVAAGEFTAVSGSSRRFVAQLNADGSIDSSFDAGSGPSGPVADVELQSDGKIVIGGEFSTVQGAARSGVARLNADGSVDAGFTTLLAGSGSVSVNEIELQSDGKILVAGSFATVNGAARSNLARLNTDGNVDASFDARLAADATVEALAVQADGEVLIGGQLRFVGGGLLPQSFVRLNADGSTDNAFALSLPTFGSVADIEVLADGKIVIGGDSTLVRLVNELVLHGPRILGIGRTQNTVQLSVSTEVGKSYVLETQTLISASAWNEVATQPGDGSIKTLTDASATGSVRFYRIRVK